MSNPPTPANGAGRGSLDGTSVAAASTSGAAPAVTGGTRTFDGDLFDQVEVVYQRATKGRHDLKRLKSYFEMRADMAKSWAKAMNKASSQPDLEDSSSIGNVWKDIRETGHGQEKAQQSFAAACMDIALVLEGQIVETKKSKTALYATYNKLVADVRKKQQIHDKSKHEYYESVKQAETAVMNRDAAHEQKQPDKAIQKVETRAKQCLKEVETQHINYQKSVQQLQEAQQTHDVTVVDLLQQFEKLERVRMRVFNDQLERFAVQHDMLRDNMNSTAASMHRHVSDVNIESDMQAFVAGHATGKPRAPHVEYLPCKSSIIDHAMDLKPTTTGNLPVAATGMHSATNSGQFGVGGIPQSTPTAAAYIAPSAGGVISTAPASTPTAAAAAAGAGGDMTCTGLYDFDQNEPDDLPFKAGDVFKLLSCPDGEEWWQGEKDGRVGIFPKAYVSKNAVGSAAAVRSMALSVPASSAAPGGATTPVAASPAVATAMATTPANGAGVNNPFGDEGAEGQAVAVAPVSTPATMTVPAGMGGAAGEVPKLMDAHCAALFDFDGQDEDELSFKAGQTLIITGELNGWYLGRVEGHDKVGIFPSNYVQMGAK